MACPNCAATLSPSILGLVGLFMTAPFVVFAVVVAVLRRRLQR
jgi:hypothetical protein